MKTAVIELDRDSRIQVTERQRDRKRKIEGER